MIFIVMNIKQIVKEEIDSFDWATNVEPDIEINLEGDYMGVWPEFEKMLSEFREGMSWIDGEVHSSDYDGNIYMRIRTNDFEFDINIHMRFNEERGDSLITWSIEDPNANSDGSDEGEYYPQTRNGDSWMKPVIDRFREMITPLVGRY